MHPDRYLSVAYKYVEHTSIYLDIYPPYFDDNKSNRSPSGGTTIRTPTVVYFHGGGMAVGNRKSWFPFWLQKRVLANGYAFISADYRLLPPSTGYDVVDDIKDLFSFLAGGELNSHLDVMTSAGSKLADGSSLPKFHVDPNAIAIAGSSAGGLCAYLAAMHVSPKPKAIISLYGMGADFLTPHYLTPKTTPFFRGREILDPLSFQEYLYPFPSLQAISDSPLSYHPDTFPIPGYPSNPRMLLARLYLQMGVFLDYFTGQHEPSLSAMLREGLSSGTNIASDVNSDPGYLTEHMRREIPEHHHTLFPQFGVTSEWPPTFLCHGSLDSAVPVHESHHLHMILEHAGVPVQFEVAEGEEHSFDYEPNAEDMYGPGMFDSVGKFLKTWLEPVRETARISSD